MKKRLCRCTRTSLDKIPPDLGKELNRANAITAFFAAPLLPKPNQLRVGHIRPYLPWQSAGPHVRQQYGS